MSVALPSELSIRRQRAVAVRRHVGVGGAQWVAGVGNLAFALAAARVLAPGQFAQLGAFLSAYVLLHLPAAGIGAGAALSTAGLQRRRRRLVGVGIAVGAALAATSPVLGDVLQVPIAMVVALAVAAPGAGLLGLERGARFGTGRHGRVAAGLVTEPAVRVLLGVTFAAMFGPVGGAVAVTAGGYAALAVTRIGDHEVADQVRTARGATSGTAVAFALFAILQQQDLLVAKARLTAELAGTFTMLSTAAGAVAFATATVPMVVLPGHGRSPHDRQVAIGLTVLVGGAATALAALVGAPVLRALFGDAYGDVSGPLPLYVAAMGLLGVGRVIGATACAQGHHRRVLTSMVVLVAGHLALLFVVPATPMGVAAATFTATAAGVGALATPAGWPTALTARAVTAVRTWASTRDLALIGALSLVAVVVRVISFRGLWVDEAITVVQAQLPFSELLDQLRSVDVHPPLHHAVVWGVVRVFGPSELAVRAPSIIAGVVLVPVVHGLGRALYGRRTGLIAAAFVSVAPFLVWYSQEARMYSLFVLLATASLWAQIAAIRGDGRWAWTAWVLTTAAMLWTQWFGIVPLLVELGIFAVALSRRRRDPSFGRLSFHVALAAVAVAVLCLPLVPFAMDQLAAYGGRSGNAALETPSQAGQGASTFSDQLSVYTIGANAIWALVGYHSDRTMVQLAALWPLLLLFGLGALGRGRSDATTGLLLATGLPAALFLLVGAVKRDLFELRYFAAVVPLLMLLAARTLTVVFRRPWSQGVAASLSVLLLAGALVDQQVNGANPRRYDFEGALDFIGREASPDDVILFAPEYLSEVVGYYANETPTRPLGASSSIDDDATVWVVATTRVASEEATSAAVGQGLADLEQTGRTITSERDFPNVQVWELEPS